MKILGMSGLLILICGFIIAVVNAQDCRSGSYYDNVNANKAVFMTDYWYLNTELRCTCSGKVDKYEVKYYSLDQSGQYSIYAAIWNPIGGSTYELDSSSITEVIDSKKRRKRSIAGTKDAVPSPPLYVRKGAIIGVYFDDSTTNNLPVLGSINGYTLCTGASANVSGITTINCSIQSTEGTNRIIHAEAQISIIECDQSKIPVISDGSFSLPDGDTEYMARVQYTCNTGYQITNSDAYLYCNEKKKWSGTVPTCTIISCPSVANTLTNGAVSVSDNGWGNYNYMSTVMFSCISDYQLNGDSSITCQANGEWSGIIPTECTQSETTTVTAESTVSSLHTHTTTALLSSSTAVSNPLIVSIVTTSTTQNLSPGGTSTAMSSHNSISTSVTTSSSIPTSSVIPGANDTSSVAVLVTSLSIASSTLATSIETTNANTNLPVTLSSALSGDGNSVTNSLPVASSTSATIISTIYSSSVTTTIVSSSTLPGDGTSITSSVPVTSTSILPGDSILNPSTSQMPLSAYSASPSQIAAADNTSGNGSSLAGIAVGILIVVIIAGLITAIVILVLVYKKRSKTGRISNEGSTNSRDGLINCSYDVVNNDVVSQQHLVPLINTVSNPEYTGTIPNATYEPVDIQPDLTASQNVTYFELENRGSPRPSSIYNSVTLEQSTNIDRLSVSVSPGVSNGIYEALNDAAGNSHRQVERTVVNESYFELEEGVFNEEPIYWEPASNTTKLYDQLARRQYREIPREDITVTDHLGSGQFGSVEKGTWHSQDGLVEVAIKTLKGVASDEDELKFLQEAAINGQFHHPNVVQLCGVVTVGQPTLIVLEYIPNGNLKEFLEQKQPLPSGGMCDDQLASLLIKFSCQIASGMLYLSNKRFIHRDLAARNILVGNNNVCKIADFGMSRDLQDESYYRSNSKRIPVKWTAPEALNFRKYSTQSDVWSYGALLYEIWSVGYKPFQQYTNQECIDLVDSGYRLASPPGCPRSVYSMMIDCWNPLTTERPTFQYLTSTFQSAMVNGIYEEAMQLKTALGSPIDDNISPYPDLQNKYR